MSQKQSLEVVIRHEDDTVSESLCFIEPTGHEIAGLLGLLNVHGVAIDGNVYREFDTQFLLSPQGAFFEIIVIGLPS